MSKAKLLAAAWSEAVKMTEHEHKEEHKHTGEQKKINYTMLAIVGLLLLFSVVQAFQINALENKLEGGASAVTATGQTASQPAARAPAASVPAMVGGC